MKARPKPYPKGRRVWVCLMGEKVKAVLTGEWEWTKWRKGREYAVLVKKCCHSLYGWIPERIARRGMRGFRS
jgi:hypothetical protein